MKAAVIGCGVIASRWVRSFLADGRIEVAALIDPNRQAAKALAARYDLKPVFATTLAEALALQQSSIDIAVNLTPPGLHHTISRAALTHGLHVLAEKPLTLNLPDALELDRLARERGLLVAVMQNRGMDPDFLEFASTVRAAGCSPLAITADTMVTLPSPGFRARQHLPVTTDLAVHAFDQVRELVTSPPVEVACIESATRFLAAHSSVATLTVRFADDSVFTYRGGYIVDSRLRTDANGDWRVEGHTFAARWAPDPGRPRVALASPPAYQQCITAMIDSLCNEGGTTAADRGHLVSIAMLDAALASADQRRPVRVPQVPDAPF